MASTGNPLSGHTAANYNTAYSANQGRATDGLRDGDQILSASFTNLLEGVHGNGVLMLEGGAVSGTNRNNPDFLPGAVSKGASAHQIKIQGGYVILDGSMYKFANGYDGTAPDEMTIELTDHKSDGGTGTTSTDNESKIGTVAALTSGKECLFTIFLSSETDSDVKHVRFEQSTVVTTGTGVYPSSPNTYLIDSDSGNALKDTVVLATVRAVFNGSANAANDLAITITEINDKRVFLKPSPMFITPLTKGVPTNKDSANSVNSHTDLDAFHTEAGDFTASPFGAIWMSHSTDKVTAGGTRLGDIGDDVLFVATNDSSGNKSTLRLAPDRVYTGSPTGVNHFTHDGPNIFIVTPGGSGCQLNPDNTGNEFAPGSIVYIRNNNASDGHPINFDGTVSSGLDHQITGGQSAIILRNNSSTQPKWSVLISAATTGTGAVSAMNNKAANRLVTIGSTTTELDGEANLTFDGATLNVGTSGDGADLLLHSATAAHVGLKWDHDDQTDGSLTLGADDHGIDFKAYGETSGKLIHWDASADTLFVTSTLDIDGPVTVGVDDTGYDVKFFGATSGAYMLWDESQDDLILGGTASLGIGDTAPGTQLQITANGPTITLKNSVDENGDGGAESNILFEDHADASLARIQGSHDGTNNDTKGKIIMSTHNGTSLTTALTINSAQKTTLAGEVVIGGDLTVNGTTTTINSTTMTTDNIILTLGGDTAPGSNDSKDKGIEFRYFDSQARIGFFGYDEDAANFTFLTAATNSSNVFSGTKGTINANLTGNLSSGTVAATTITGSADMNIGSGKFFVDVSDSKVGVNQGTPLAQLQVDKVGFESITVDSGSSTSNAVVTLCTRSQFRSLKVFISTKADDDSAFEATEMLVVQNGSSSGTTAETTYGTVTIGGGAGGSPSAIAAYSTAISSDNVQLTINYNQVGGANKDFTSEIHWIGLAV
tara:strand:- start:3788 stop:6619 length:2832 start_codon:yes stop_codon:yes gene_type:complete